MTVLRKLAILTVFICLTAASSARAQSLFFPVRNDFQAGVTLAGVQPGAGIRVATGDLDNDGNTDAIVTVEEGEPPATDPLSTDHENIFVFLGDGRGLFVLHKVLELPRRTFPGDVVTGHFNSDANLDVAVAVEDLDGIAGPSTNGGVIIGFGDGTGDFPNPSTLEGQQAESGLTGIAKARLDGDAIDDLVIVNSLSNSFTTFLSPHDGMGTPLTVSTCSGPVALALGDLDQMPGIDLAVACDPIGGDDVVRTYGGVNGVFTQLPPPAPTTLNDPRDMVIADLNNDPNNIQDIAIVNSFLSDLTNPAPSGTITLLRNDGNANFDEFTASGVPVGFTPRSIDAGDIDGDGDIDLLVANWESQDLSVLQASIVNTGSNNNSPTYTETFFAAGFNTFAAAFADLDGRGNLDVVAVNGNAFNGTLSAFLGGGDDLVQRAVRFTSSGNIELPNAVAVADFNNDGFDDFALANAFSDTVSVFRSTAGDTNPADPFALLATLTFTAFDLPFDVLADDLDGDGDQDLVVLLSPDAGNGHVEVFRNNGSGAFSKVGSNLPVGLLPWAMVLADLDNDGTKDLAATNLLDHSVSLFQGGPGAGFTALGSFASTNGGACDPGNEDPDCLPNGIAAGDIDGDGNRDLVVSAFGGASGGTLQVFSGDGAFGFTHVNELSSPDPVVPTTTVSHQVVALSRLDGTSGPPDIVAIGLAPDDLVSVFLNDGTGNTTFTPGPTSPFLFPAIDLPAPDAPRNTLVQDLNNDGLPDIATIGIDSNNVGVLLGNGDGTFSSTRARAQAFGTIKAPNALGAGDFDGDGLLDFLAAGARLDDVAILHSGFQRRSDLDGTGRVDGFDLALLGIVFGISEGNPAYDFFLDANLDGTIDGADLTILALAFGMTF